MKPETENNVAHPYLRNLAYHCLDDNALQTITFDRVIFLNNHKPEIVREVRAMAEASEEAVLASIQNGSINGLGTKEFLQKLMPLEKFDQYSDLFLGEALGRLKGNQKDGIKELLNYCFTHNIDPLLAIAYQSLNHGKKAVDIDTHLLKNLSEAADKHPALNKFLNIVAIITARELGLLNENESLILRSLQEKIDIQNCEVHGLSTLLRNALHVVQKIKPSRFRLASPENEEIWKLLSGKSLVRFTNKLYELRGYVELQDSPEAPHVAELNWDKQKAINTRGR